MERSQLGGIKMYKVKNFKSNNGNILQSKIKMWIESREHITILSINTFNDKDLFYCTIVYREIDYVM